MAMYSVCWRMSVLMVAACMAGCGGGGGDKGGQCQACRSSAPRCDGDLVCRGFYNSNIIVELCATPQTSTCATP